MVWRARQAVLGEATAPRRVRRGPRVAALAVVAAAAFTCGLAATAFIRRGLDDEDGAYTLVLLRHGESQWNLENRFTGWVDVDVSETGAEEAKGAGRLMREANLTFAQAFTSYQKRAMKTLNLALEEMDQLWIPVTKSWRLNERMYGDLQGANKAEATQKFGEEQVTQWRRSYDVPPPVIAPDNPYHPKLDPKYEGIPQDQLPLTESLAIVVDRVLPFWKRGIVPALKKGKCIIIAAHGNSLRALVKYLDDIPQETILGLNIPTGVPLVYKLDRKLKPILQPGHAEHLSGAYLGDPEWVNGKIHGVANQAKGR